MSCGGGCFAALRRCFGVVVGAGILWGVMACGGEDESQRRSSRATAQSLSSWSPVVHGSAEDIQRGRVRSLEYLVAFKSPAPERGLLTPSPELSLWSEPVLAETVTSSPWVRGQVLAAIPFFETRAMDSSSQEALPAVFRLLTDRRGQHSYAQVVKMRFVHAQQAREHLQELWEQGKIWYAHPNYVSSLKQESEQSIRRFFRQRDFKRLSQVYEYVRDRSYYIGMIQLDKAMNYLHSLPAERQSKILKKRPIVAVLDSGADVMHPALKDRLARFSVGAFQHARGCRGDRYGCNVSDEISHQHLGDHKVHPVGTAGFNAVCPPSTRKNLLRYGWCNHGTHVAGLIVGFDQNVYGVCPVCDFLPVRIVDSRLQITDVAIMRGLHYVALFQASDGRRVQVVNASFGKEYKSYSVALLIRALEKNHNVVFVAAAGNDNTFLREYPASLDEVIGVSAVNVDYAKLRTSNYGGWVNVSAPGRYIVSSIPGNSLGTDNGTSMAAPMVAGVAGLLQAVSTKPLSASQVRYVIESSANASVLYDANPLFRRKQHTGSGSGVPGTLGWGVLDVYGALMKIKDPSSLPALSQTRLRGYENQGGCAVLGHDALITTPKAVEEQTWRRSVYWMLWLLLLPLLVLSSISTRRREP